MSKTDIIPIIVLIGAGIFLLSNSGTLNQDKEPNTQPPVKACFTEGEKQYSCSINGLTTDEKKYKVLGQKCENGQWVAFRDQSYYTFNDCERARLSSIGESLGISCSFLQSEKVSEELQFPSNYEAICLNGDWYPRVKGSTLPISWMTIGLSCNTVADCPTKVGVYQYSGGQCFPTGSGCEYRSVGW